METFLFASLKARIFELVYINLKNFSFFPLFYKNAWLLSTRLKVGMSFGLIKESTLFLHIMLWFIRDVSVKKSFYAISFFLFLKADVLSSWYRVLFSLVGCRLNCSDGLVCYWRSSVCSWWWHCLGLWHSWCHQENFNHGTGWKYENDFCLNYSGVHF